MYVVGTAGHVDHGKSTLIKALTGIDPDRLEEEKRRGLTIDLGFAWLELPSGRTVGIVDVPGHERFIKNMLAGVGAINATLFVVAANEGWKPQSQEHLDILDLLGVSAAIIVLTKADAVDDAGFAGSEGRSARLEEVRRSVREKVRGTSLQDAPIVEVSAVSGMGLEQLRQELDRLLSASPPAEDRDRPRLWIDRVFSMKGSGTVVTGTLTGGSLAKGQEVQILPDGEAARIRSIQSHHKELSEVGPGNRVALNLTGLEQQELRRGDVLTLPKRWRISDRVLAWMKFIGHLDYAPTEKGAFKLYVGSLELDAQLRFLERPPPAGGEGFALIRLDRPTAFDFKDHFVLRDAGRRQTLGGGLILEPQAAALRSPGDRPAAEKPGAVSAAGGTKSRLVSAARSRLEAPDRAAYLRVCLEEEGYLRIADIGPRTGLGMAEARAVRAVWLPGHAVSEDFFEGLRAEIVRRVGEHHTGRPLDPGMPLAALRAELELEPRLFQEVSEELIARRELVGDASAVRLPGFAPQIESPEKKQLLEWLNSAGPSVPSAGEISRRFPMDLVRALVRSGELVQVSSELFYPAGWIAQVKHQIARLVETAGPFTVAQFRDVIGASRKYAVPLLEYLDGLGFTRRQADLRTLGPAASSSRRPA